MINSLEERLKDTGNINKFNSDAANLEPDLRKIVETLFGIGHILQQRGLSKDYVIYGGYAVFLQLLNTVKVANLGDWRGSYDLDIVGTEKTVSLIKENYQVVSDRKSEKVKGKRTLRILLDSKKETIKVDILQKEAFVGNPDMVYENDIEQINLYGIAFNVVSPIRQLKNKLSVSRELARDRYDIITLLGITYHKKVTDGEISNYLDLKERKRLYDLLKGQQIENILKEDNIVNDIVPSNDFKAYLTCVKKSIKKRGV